MNRFLTFFIILISFLQCKGQKPVQDSGYAVTLNTLLSHDVKEISVVDAMKIEKEAIFLDTREKKEFEVSHIKNAIWLGYNTFDISSVKNLDKNKKIIVYCSVGYRSEKITQKLVKAGFKNVYNLYGGIFEWVNEGNLVYNTTGSTKKIHAYDKSWGIWLKKGEKVY